MKKFSASHIEKFFFKKLNRNVGSVNDKKCLKVTAYNRSAKIDVFFGSLQNFRQFMFYNRLFCVNCHDYLRYRNLLQ